MRPEDTERVLQEMLADHHDRMVEFDRENEVDFAFAVRGWRGSGSTRSASAARSRSSRA